MSVEKAEEFIRKLKEDENFRHMVGWADDPRAVKALLLCEKLIFTDMELMGAMAAEIERHEHLATYVGRGWKLVAK